MLGSCQFFIQKLEQWIFYEKILFFLKQNIIIVILKSLIINYNSLQKILLSLFSKTICNFPFMWQRVEFIQPMKPERSVYGKTRGPDSCVDYDHFGDIAREGGP